MITEPHNTSGLEIEDLPKFIKLRSGGIFELTGDYWRFQDGVHRLYFDFEKLPEQVSPLIFNLKRVVINVLEELSPWTAYGMLNIFSHLASVVKEREEGRVSVIEVRHILNYISKYSPGDTLGMESRLGTLISKWTKLGFAGFSAEAVNLIKSRRKPGSVKGESVRTMDPVKGPLIDLELQEFISALNDAYAEKKINKDLYLIAWLAILTGQRVSQFCLLKVCDLLQPDDANGDVKYEINIPTGKKQNEASRESFLNRPLPFQFGQVLWTFAQEARKANLERGEMAPMFPGPLSKNGPLQLNPEFLGHWDSMSLCAYFDAQLAPIAPVSPRTFEPMHIAIGRFRKTLGTRAAQEGYGELVIAEMLGHEDTQNVKVYVGIVPEIAARLDKQLARDLAPIANAFSGKVLRSPQDATRANDATSQIIDYKYAKAGVGSCGTTYDCHFNAPIACYTCRNFEAWADAPHQILLDHLLSERERLWKTSGQRIASQNDNVIFAIQAVIFECEYLKRQQKALNG
jgi:integrase